MKLPVLSFALVNSASGLQTHGSDFFLFVGKLARGGPISMGMPLCFPGGAVAQTSFNSYRGWPKVVEATGTEGDGDGGGVVVLPLGDVGLAAAGGNGAVGLEGGTGGPLAATSSCLVSFMVVTFGFSVVLVSRVCRV